MIDAAMRWLWELVVPRVAKPLLELVQLVDERWIRSHRQEKVTRILEARFYELLVRRESLGCGDAHYHFEEILERQLYEFRLGPHRHDVHHAHPAPRKQKVQLALSEIDVDNLEVFHEAVVLLPIEQLDRLELLTDGALALGINLEEAEKRVLVLLQDLVDLLRVAVALAERSRVVQSTPIHFFLNVPLEHPPECDGHVFLDSLVNVLHLCNPNENLQPADAVECMNVSRALVDRFEQKIERRLVHVLTFVVYQLSFLEKSAVRIQLDGEGLTGAQRGVEVVDRIDEPREVMQNSTTIFDRSRRLAILDDEGFRVVLRQRIHHVLIQDSDHVLVGVVDGVRIGVLGPRRPDRLGYVPLLLDDLDHMLLLPQGLHINEFLHKVTVLQQLVHCIAEGLILGVAGRVLLERFEDGLASLRQLPMARVKVVGRLDVARLHRPPRLSLRAQ
mmetsp:Transcript_62307/g.171174  ORF Transcript_62307/g.171174 Transcript_62307/m.171174 type:complete len:446 (+) Transcript_62307:711-2048(+)